eukprot:scaffold1397_cov254-Pinguiococcus_pyrenoidosus.AAC.12
MHASTGRDQMLLDPSRGRCRHLAPVASRSFWTRSKRSLLRVGSGGRAARATFSHSASPARPRQDPSQRSGRPSAPLRWSSRTPAAVAISPVLPARHPAGLRHLRCPSGVGRAFARRRSDSATHKPCWPPAASVPLAAVVS